SRERRRLLVIASDSEAIQWLAREAGLLRRHGPSKTGVNALLPRNDEWCKKHDRLPVNARSKAMKEPTTAEEVKVLHELLRSDTERYLQIVNEWIEENPRNSHAYFERHFAWMKLGDPQRALDDLNMVIQLDPEPVAFRSRGQVHRHLGEYG